MQRSNNRVVIKRPPFLKVEDEKKNYPKVYTGGKRTRITEHFKSQKSRRPNYEPFRNPMPRRNVTTRRSRPSVNRGLRMRKRSTRYRRRANGFRRGRRFSRKRLSRFRRGRKKNSFKKAVISAITPLDTYSRQRGDVWVTGSSNTTTGMVCNYFTINSEDPYGPDDPVGILCPIAAHIVTRAGLSLPYSIQYVYRKGTLCTKVTNASNRVVSIVAYKVMARRDIPNVAPYNSGADSILTILGRGFADAGIDTTNRGATNNGLNRIELTPYESPFFCQNFKILKTRKNILYPGRQAAYKITVRKPFVVRPDKYIDRSLTTSTYANGTFVVFYKRGEMFWLFKVTSSTIGNIASDSLNVNQAPLRLNTLTYLNVDYQYINNAAPDIVTSGPYNIASGATSSTLYVPNVSDTAVAATNA